MVIISAALSLGYPFLIASKISKMPLSSPKFAGGVGGGKRDRDLETSKISTQISSAVLKPRKFCFVIEQGFKTNSKKVVDK